MPVVKCACVKGRVGRNAQPSKFYFFKKIKVYIPTYVCVEGGRRQARHPHQRLGGWVSG